MLKTANTQAHGPAGLFVVLEVLMPAVLSIDASKTKTAILENRIAVFLLMVELRGVEPLTS